MSPTHYLKVKDIEFILLCSTIIGFTVGVGEKSARVRLASSGLAFV